jgi:hypothetical protein
MAGVGVIETYVAELGRTLRGPRRAKADLLAEARDSLVDAAEARRVGLSHEEAEHEAVAEFGAIRDIAPGYQTELGLAQARRTALVVFGVLAALEPASHLAWRSGGPSATSHPAWYPLLAHLVDWVGIAALGGALLGVAGCAIGVRHLSVGRGLTRSVGVFAAAVAGCFAAGGLLLTLGNPAPPTLATATWTLVALGSLAWVGGSARRCLGAA